MRSIRLVQKIVDAPPNILHTDSYVKECMEVMSKLKHCNIEVIAGHELEKRGFGGNTLHSLVLLRN